MICEVVVEELGKGRVQEIVLQGHTMLLLLNEVSYSYLILLQADV